MSVVFLAADLSQIEARVLAWLSGQQDILDVFASGQDVYVYTAKAIGSDNRQLGKVCVLGLGYGMGWAKFIDTALVMGGLKIDEAFARKTVQDWRAANQHTVNFWWDLDRAFRTAVDSEPGTRIPVGYVEIVRGKDAIAIRLPSGRSLIYRNPRIETLENEDRPSILFDGIQQTTRQWGPIRTYGGKLAENITQAVARDVMAFLLLALDERSFDLRLTVHDEIVAVERADCAAERLEEMLAVMRQPPPWAHGLPMGCEGWHGRRYRK